LNWIAWFHPKYKSWIQNSRACRHIEGNGANSQWNQKIPTAKIQSMQRCDFQLLNNQ